MHAKDWKRGLWIGILLLVAAWLAMHIWGLATKAHVAISEARQTRSQYETLEERKATLQGNIAALETALGQDAAIRTAFGVARPGEEVIVVVPPKEATTTPKKSWWQMLFDWF